MLKNFTVFLFFIFLILSCKQTEVIPDYSEFKTEDSQLNYRILYPKDFDRTKSYPLTLFLHGIGERGDDNNIQLRYVDKVFLDSENYNKFPSVVIITTIIWVLVTFATPAENKEVLLNFYKEYSSTPHLPSDL